MKRWHTFFNQAVNSHVMRYLVVGTINTGFGYLVYAGLLFAGLDYKFANLLALILGILVSFKTQGHLVFKNPNNRLFGRFVLSWAIIYIFTIVLIGRIIALGFNAYWAGALALPFSVTISYFAQKYFVFRPART